MIHPPGCLESGGGSFQIMARSVMPDSPAQPLPEGELPALLDEAKQGSQEAIGALLERHRAYLWALAHEAIAGESHLTHTVADIVQSAQLEALRDLASFRGSSEGEFRSWLRHILRNNVIDLKRARERRLPRAGPEASRSKSNAISTIAVPAARSRPASWETSSARRSASCRPMSEWSSKCTTFRAKHTRKSANSSAAVPRQSANCGDGRLFGCN